MNFIVLIRILITYFLIIHYTYIVIIISATVIIIIISLTINVISLMVLYTLPFSQVNRIIK